MEPLSFNVCNLGGKPAKATAELAGFDFLGADTPLTTDTIVSLARRSSTRPARMRAADAQQRTQPNDPGSYSGVVVVRGAELLRRPVTVTVAEKPKPKPLTAAADPVTLTPTATGRSSAGSRSTTRLHPARGPQPASRRPGAVIGVVSNGGHQAS